MQMPAMAAGGSGSTEAYGPHEVERILGEGIAPFRNRVIITSSSAGTSISTPASACRASTPAGAHQAGRRGHAAAPEDRPHRPAVPASCRPPRCRSQMWPAPSKISWRKARSSAGACPRWGRTHCAVPMPPCPSLRSNIRCCGAGRKSAAHACLMRYWPIQEWRHHPSPEGLLQRLRPCSKNILK